MRMGKIETDRFTLYPMTRRQLRRIIRDPRGVSAEFGATMKPYGFIERLVKNRIYRAKLAMIDDNPAYTLLCTMWMIVDKASGEIVGEAGFKGAPINGEVEIGYSTRTFVRGKGYMTQAVKAMCEFAFGCSGIIRVAALTKSDNLSSHRVLIKNGFVRDGFRGRYWYWYTIKK